MGDPDWYVGNYEFQRPIFVLTHRPPATAPRQDDQLTFTFVNDGAESAVARASATAGQKTVTVVGGVDVMHQLLRAGLVDELRIDVMPVVLGSGLRLFEEDAGEFKLQKTGVQDVGMRTSLRFRVQR
ncbi:MAG: dihydrofolate reductase family protein [Acidimicrobiales bacterium]